MWSIGSHTLEVQINHLEIRCVKLTMNLIWFYGKTLQNMDMTRVNDHGGKLPGTDEKV